MKHIKELAKNLCESSATLSLVEALTAHLMDVRNALLEGQFYIGVRSVSKSGMSRELAIAIVDESGVTEVWPAVYKLAGCDKKSRIKGCGMDMRFAAQYNLFLALCPDMSIRTKMPRYNHLA